MDNHIIKSRTYYRIKAEVLIADVWDGTIHGLSRPYDAMIVDNKYILPKDKEPIIEDFSGSIVRINGHQYGGILANSISLYRSPSVGIILQINSDEYSIDEGAWIYT